MKGYFISEDQISNLKERIEIEKLQGTYNGDQSKRELIGAITESLHRKVLTQVEDWIKYISK